MADAPPQGQRGRAKLIARIAVVHSNHRRIASGALLIGALTLVAKLFVAAREMAIAWRYGVSSTVDAYQLALTATTWVPNMLAGVMAVVLVPRLVRLQRDGGDRRAFLAELNGSVLLLGLAVAVFTWLAAPGVAALLTSNTDSQTTALTASMIAGLAPVSFLTILAGYSFARLQSRERFGYSVTEALPALAIALFVISPLGLAGATGLIGGTLVGYGLQLAVLGFIILRGDTPFSGLRLCHSSEEWRSLYGSLLLMVCGQLLITASIPIDQGFAARLGEGAVATLGYANRIIALFSTLGTVVVGRALLPVLSRTVADGDLELGRWQALQWSMLLGGVAIIGSGALWVATPELIHLLFERGAFTAAAAADVSNVLRWGLIQLPFYFAGMALVQWYAAVGRFRSFLLVTGVALLCKVPLNALLINRFGVEGIMISTSVMYAVTLLVLIALLRGPERLGALSLREAGHK